MMFKYWSLSGTSCPFFYIEAETIGEADKLFQAEFGTHPSKLSKIVVRFETTNYVPGHVRKDHMAHLPKPTFFYKDLLKLLGK